MGGLGSPTYCGDGSGLGQATHHDAAGDRVKLAMASQRTPRLPPTAPPTRIADLTFRDPRHADVGIHTLRLKEIYQRSPSGAPEQHARHRVPVHMLALVTAGRASFSVDFEMYPCRPGGLLWVRPGQVVGFPPPGVDATLVLFHDQPTHPQVLGGTYWQPGGEDGEAIVDGVSQLEIDYQRLMRGDDIPVAVLRHQLALLLLRLSRLEPEGGPGQAAADNELLTRFRAAIDEQFALTRQVEDYARLLGCSVRTLTRASLAAAGRTAKQLVDDRVALEAKRLLAESDLSAAEISARLGFTEATNFGRFFSRTVGCSPLAFRAASRAEQEDLAPAATPPAQPLVAALAKAGAARGSLPPPPEDIANRGLTVRPPRTGQRRTGVSR
jgi:AraC-like DNA-binding protein